MKINDELTVKIEKMSNLGFGIAKYEGQVIFVENACTEDELKIKITKANKNYATASIVEIITPSNYRVEPFCPMFKVCGGCQFQFIDYEYQLKIKKQIVEDEFRNLGISVNETIASPEIKNYRHKIQYPISQTKVSKRILAGYYKPKSHEVVNIKFCPIQPQKCDEIIEFIRESAFEYSISGYNEKKHNGDLRHVVMRVSADNGKILLTLVVNSTRIFEKLKDFAQNLYDNFEEISGICINFNSQKTNVIMGQNTELLCGEDTIEEKLLDKTFIIGANSFFQINPKSAENIIKYVKNYIKKEFDKPLILDAYSGVGAFGISLSDNARKVVCFEENKQAVELADKIVRTNGIENVELHNQTAEQFFKTEAKKKRKFNYIILDPPRKGCSKESLENCLKFVKSKIIYVSCNPSTLARDLKFLQENGGKIESVQPFDMFCHTYHVETVAIVNFN